MNKNPLNYLLRLSVLVVMIFTTCKMRAQVNVSELEEYFYPNEEFSYIRTPDSGNSRLASTYELLNDNSKLLTKMLAWENGSLIKMSEQSYNIAFDQNKREVISTSQITKNPFFGARRSSNTLKLFVLPMGDETVKWEQTENGETSSCTSKYTYIKFKGTDGKVHYEKAIKMVKTTPLDESRAVKEWSYWVKGLSRIASFGYWGDPNKVRSIEKSLAIDFKEPIKEVSKIVYDQNHK